MIDIHNHLLYGVDDGASSLDETKKMLWHAYQDGIKAIIVTPHYRYKMERKDNSELELIFKKIVEWMEEVVLPMKLYLGHEAFLDEELVEDLVATKCKTLAGSRYVLVEFYQNAPLLTLKKIIFQMRVKNYVPIIAHCERLIEDKADLSKLQELTELGCLLQVNARTIVSPDGRFEKKWLLNYLKEERISFIASDAHNLTTRTPELKEAYLLTVRRVGQQIADRIFIHNPNKIIANEPIGCKASLK